jgi:hypothetical protein
MTDQTKRAETPRTDALYRGFRDHAKTSAMHQMTDLARELEASLAVAEKERGRLQAMFDEAVRVQGDAEVLKYVTSGNTVPVTRCTVSADLIRQLVTDRTAAEARIAELEKDAKRYRWLREQNWNDAPLCVVRAPRYAIRLGYDCPSRDRLDVAIDAALSTLPAQTDTQQGNVACASSGSSEDSMTTTAAARSQL